MGNVDLYKGDCLEVMDKLIEQGVKVDMILTDPPYGTTQCKWDSVIPFYEMWKRLKLLRRDTTPIVLFGSEPFSSFLRCSNIKEFKYDWVWDKVTGFGHLNAKRQPLQRTEVISVFYKTSCLYIPQMVEIDIEKYNEKISKISKKKSYTSKSEITGVKKELSINDRDIELYKYAYPQNVITLSKYNKECNNKNRVHPTQKPIDLLEYLIKTYTNEGETILDFTMGSGSTGVACVNTNRNFIGIELDDTYYNVAVKRIDEAKNNINK